MLALVPVRDGVLPAGGAEAAAECGGRCLVVGTGAIAAAAEIPGANVQHADLGDYRPGAWAAALADLLRRGGAGFDDAIVLLPASPDGRDLAPRLAAQLGVPLFAGAVSVSTTSVVLARDGGLHMHTIVPPASFVATLQPGVRGVDAHRADIASIAPIPPIELALQPGADADVIEVLPADAATIDLAEAHRILGGGAGLDGPRRFEQLASLGVALGASVGATRVITDRGWIGHARQIGTTGVVVDPELYLAFGVSGAVQHTSGLGQPRHIISVNTAAHCPMMQLADLAIVADANATLDELSRLLAVDATAAEAAHG